MLDPIPIIKSFLNQARAGCRSANAWFLRIASVREYLYVCMCTYVCVRLRQPRPSSKPFCYLTTAVLKDYYSKVTAYNALAYSVFMMHMDANYKIMPTDNTDYSCNIKPYNLFNQSYHTTSFIDSLWGGHTHTYWAI